MSELLRYRPVGVPAKRAESSVPTYGRVAVEMGKDLLKLPLKVLIYSPGVALSLLCTPVSLPLAACAAVTAHHRNKDHALLPEDPAFSDPGEVAIEWLYAPLLAQVRGMRAWVASAKRRAAARGTNGNV